MPENARCRSSCNHGPRLPAPAAITLPGAGMRAARRCHCRRTPVNRGRAATAVSHAPAQWSGLSWTCTDGGSAFQVRRIAVLSAHGRGRNTRGVSVAMKQRREHAQHHEHERVVVLLREHRLDDEERGQGDHYRYDQTGFARAKLFHQQLSAGGHDGV